MQVQPVRLNLALGPETEIWVLSEHAFREEKLVGDWFWCHLEDIAYEFNIVSMKDC